MTRAQLILIASVVSGLGAGAIVFLTRDAADNGVDASFTAPPMFEQLDRSSCTPRACNAPACNQVKAVLLDAGTGCTVGFADCSVRVGPVARAIGLDAGLALTPALYQRIGFIGMRCPGIDGGFAGAIPVDDAGWPLFGLQVTTPLCVRAPLDGGLTCLRDIGDGGRFFGTGNVFTAGQAAGANCEPVECAVFAGEDPDQTL